MKLLNWIKDGNDCSKCPAVWSECCDTECGCEYDGGCYAGKDDCEICRLPMLIRKLKAKQSKYYRNHEYDDYPVWADSDEKKSDCFQEALSKFLEHYLLGWKDENGDFNECDKETIIYGDSWNFRNTYDKFNEEIPKKLSQKWRELAKETLWNIFKNPIMVFVSIFCK